MERDLSIRPVRENIRSCNGCMARTYESSTGISIGHRVDRLWEVVIGNMVVTLCDDCLNNLAQKIEALPSRGAKYAGDE